jgi:chromosome segregation ATPase
MKINNMNNEKLKFKLEKELTELKEEATEMYNQIQKLRTHLKLKNIQIEDIVERLEKL